MREHILFSPASMTLRLLDQRHLPNRMTEVICRTCEDVASAIRDMVVRGAPAIGVTAAFGCVLAAFNAENSPAWRNDIGAQLQHLRSSRPTAINLAWAVDRMEALLERASSKDELVQCWLDEAVRLQEEDREICRRLGKIGSVVLSDGDTVLTHCNAGALATAGHGTALGVIRSAIEEGKQIKVIADETRPFMQGSRLTAWELAEDNIPVTLACDNAAAHLMSKNQINVVITGADRIAANGDTANKIGTLGVAILANFYHIPFYIAAPLSTIDPHTPNGGQIPIEERPARELEEYLRDNTIPPHIPAYNFAFDVTPASLITGIITEAGILRPPYEKNIQKIVEAWRNGA